MLYDAEQTYVDQLRHRRSNMDSLSHFSLRLLIPISSILLVSDPGTRSPLHLRRANDSVSLDLILKYRQPEIHLESVLTTFGPEAKSDEDVKREVQVAILRARLE